MVEVTIAKKIHCGRMRFMVFFLFFGKIAETEAGKKIGKRVRTLGEQYVRWELLFYSISSSGQRSIHFGGVSGEAFLRYNMVETKLSGRATMSMTTDSSQPSASTKPVLVSERPLGRAANWTVGVISAVLVLISVGGYFYHREQLSVIAAEHLRLIVTGPAAIQAGVDAIYTVSTTAISGQPLSAQIEADIVAPDGQRLKGYKEPADEHGRLKVIIPADLKLPSQITLAVTAVYQKSREEAMLTIRVAQTRCMEQDVLMVRSVDGTYPSKKPTIVQKTPLKKDATPSIDVAFYPEGGEMACGLENRVYFVARDAQGNPASISGTVVAKRRQKDVPEEDIASIQTTHEGRGTFTIVPLEDETYSLKVTNPKGIKNRFALPEATKDCRVVLSAGSGVFAADKPLEFNLRAAKSGMPLVVAAYRCGIQVGQQPVVTKAGATGANPVVIALDDAASGVLRLAVFDYTTAPPKRVAERLVFRQPKQRLQVRIDNPKKEYASGEKVELSLSVSNEKGEPVPATLAVSLAEAGSPKPTQRASTYSLLTSRLERTENMKLADFYVSNETMDKVSGPVALDLLLGVQPASESLILPPLMFDNLNQIHANYEKNLTEYQAGRTKLLNTLTTASFYGGLGLLLLVAMLGLMRIVAGMHLWIPAIGATTCCLIVGAILLDPSRLTTNQNTSAAFAPYCELPTSKEPLAKSDGLPPKLDRPSGKPAVQPEKPTASAATLFWPPLLVAGPDGKAVVRFTLPASPSTFRITIDAQGANRFGDAQIEIVSRNSK